MTGSFGTLFLFWGDPGLEPSVGLDFSLIRADPRDQHTYPTIRQGSMDLFFLGPFPQAHLVVSYGVRSISPIHTFFFFAGRGAGGERTKTKTSTYSVPPWLGRHQIRRDLKGTGVALMTRIVTGSGEA